MANVNIPITKLNEKSVLTAKIKITNRFILRVKAATFLIKMAAWALGCGVDIRFDNTQDKHEDRPNYGEWKK